jgi:CheY-like chemotaxis protein
MSAGRILVIDHNPINLKLVRVTLAREGFQTLVTGFRAMPRHYPLSFHHRSRDVDADASGKRGG